MLAYGGIMKNLHKKLNLEDEIEGSLENSGIGMSNDSKAVVQSTYVWNTGYRNYIKVI